MESGKYYVLSEGKILSEGMTKEQILAAIVQAVETHAIADVDTGFVSMLKEKNKDKQLTFWVGTTAEYNAIQTPVQNCFYILTDETDIEDLEEAIEQLAETVDSLAGCKNKTLLNQTVPNSAGYMLSIEFEGDRPITAYTLVKVTIIESDDPFEVLCTVENDTGLIHGTTILPSNAELKLASIRLYYLPEANILNSQRSSTFTFSDGLFQEDPIAITKIVGVY